MSKVTQTCPFCRAPYVADDVRAEPTCPKAACQKAWREGFTEEQIDGMVRDACTVGDAVAANVLVRDLCCHVKALACEVERLQPFEEYFGNYLRRWNEERKDNNRLRHALKTIAGLSQSPTAARIASEALARKGKKVGPCGVANHAADCDCQGAGGDR